MSVLLLVAIILYAVCATWSFATSDRKDAEALLAALRLDDLRGQQKPKPHQFTSGAWSDFDYFGSKVAQYMSRFSFIEYEDCFRNERNDKGFCEISFKFAPKNEAAAGIFENQMKDLIKLWVCCRYGFDTHVHSSKTQQQGVIWKYYAFAINQEQLEKLNDWENKMAALERAESARTKPPMKTTKSL